VVQDAKDSSLSTGDKIVRDSFLAAVGLICTCLAVSNAPLAFSAASMSGLLGLSNFGEPFEIFAAADKWRDELGGFTDQVAALKKSFVDTNAGTWQGVARDKFEGYLDQMQGLAGKFDGASSMMYNELQWFALSVAASDIAIVVFAFAVGAILASLLPGLVPAGETEPAIGATAVSYLKALALFAGDILLLEEAGRFLAHNVQSAADGLTTALWQGGPRDPHDLLRNNSAVMAVPPVSQWQYDPSLDRLGR
jgi:hypothetical protein